MLPLLLFYGDLYASTRRACHASIVAPYAFASFRSALALFGGVRTGLDDLGQASCSVCKYRLLSACR